MTKQDFEMIAKVIAEMQSDLDHKVYVEILPIHVAERFAGVLRAKNPRFDTSRFLKACGVQA